MGAVAVVVAASATAETTTTINSSGLHSPTHSIMSIISTSGLHSPPHNIKSSSRRSISGSHVSINSNSSSSSGRQDTLAGGGHRVFVSVATSPDTFMQGVDRYLPRR